MIGSLYPAVFLKDKNIGSAVFLPGKGGRSPETAKDKTNGKYSD
jgi:hypothetical protein